MFRRGLSLFLGLAVIAFLLAACRGRGEDVTLPTPVETDAGVTFVPPDDATAIAATSTLAATAIPLPTSSATPLTIIAAPSATVAGAATAVPPTVNPGPPPGGSARINFAPGAT